jgi:hypothetical protein
MNKEKMTAKVAEVLEAQDIVESFLDEIELTAGQHKQAIVELEQEVAKHTEALGMADDLGQAGLIRKKIKDTEEQIELVKMVNENKVRAKYQELENKAEAFFAVHKEAQNDFTELEKVMIATTGLGQLRDNSELMTGFAYTLNNSFTGVRTILLDTKIVSLAEQNMMYRGYHLGQRGLMTELSEFEHKVNPYIYQLKSAGKL